MLKSRVVPGSSLPRRSKQASELEFELDVINYSKLQALSLIKLIRSSSRALSPRPAV